MQDEQKTHYKILLLVGLINVIWIISSIFIPRGVQIVNPNYTEYVYSSVMNSFLGAILPNTIFIISYGVCLLTAAIKEQSETKSLKLAGISLIACHAIWIVFGFVGMVQIPMMYVGMVQMLSIILVIPCAIAGGFFIFNYGRVKEKGLEKKQKLFTIAGLLFMLNVIFWFFSWMRYRIQTKISKNHQILKRIVHSTKISEKKRKDRIKALLSSY